MYLLDTNVVSELRKLSTAKIDLHVARWANEVDARDLYLSVITLQELEIGVQRIERRDATQGSVLRTWLTQHVLPTFAGRVLNIDATVALHSAGLHVPDPKPVRDTFIAATAMVHNMTVVTRNVADFQYSALKLLNPWRAHGV